MLCGPLPQGTTNDFKLEPPRTGALDAKSSTATPNDEDGATQFSVTKSEMPPDHHLLTAKPGARERPPDSANLAQQENNQVNTGGGDTPVCGRDKVAGY